MSPGKSRGEVVPNGGDLQRCEWKRGAAFPPEQQQMQLVGERIAHGSAEVLLEGTSGGLVQLLLLTGLLAAFVLKLLLEEDEGDRV